MSKRLSTAKETIALESKNQTAFTKAVKNIRKSLDVSILCILSLCVKYKVLDAGFMFMIYAIMNHDSWYISVFKNYYTVLYVQRYSYA